jgi:hypothetical protein
MPFKIQRTPRGLNNLLSLSGGQTPQELEDRIRGVLDVLQYYSLMQERQVTGNNAALAEGGAIDIVSPDTEWWVLKSLNFTLVKTATMTACHLRLEVGQVAGPAGVIFARSLEPFGATETGTIADGLILPYQRILPPRSVLRVAMGILGTDANANVGVSGVVGILGG